MRIADAVSYPGLVALQGAAGGPGEDKDGPADWPVETCAIDGCRTRTRGCMSTGSRPIPMCREHREAVLDQR